LFPIETTSFRICVTVAGQRTVTFFVVDLGVTMNGFAKVLGVMFLGVSSLLIITKISACGGGKKDNPGSTSNGGGGNVNVKVTGASSAALNVVANEGCDCSTPGTSMGGPICGSNPQGKCYTPKAIRGHFNQLNVSAGRLLGGGDKYHGLESVFRTGYFDFAKPILLDGDDNLQDGQNTSGNMVSMSVQSIEYQFLAAGKYFNVRIPMVTIPAAQDPQFLGCIDEGGLGESAKYTKLYADGIVVTAGDILVCIKDTETAECKDADYNWVDSSGTLTAMPGTRPTSPLRLTGAHAFNKSSCTAGSDHPSVTWGSLDFYASVASPLGVTAKIDAGKKIYTKGADTGNTLDVTVAFDMSNQLFVPNAAATAFANSDYTTHGVTIRQNLDKIMLRQVYQYNTRTSTSVNIDSDNMGTATVTATVSTKEEADDGDVEDLSQTLRPNE
jgi:hypothetical protein